MGKLLAALSLSVIGPSGIAASQPVPSAIFTDPVPDRKSPAAMEVLHVPSGSAAINGVAYLASGKGPHPTMVLMHGLPGNEKNLDLAQAVRRAGWNAVTFNYRGSWGSPGTFGFASSLDVAQAVLGYLRSDANAVRLRVDPRRIVVAGHSMAGWVAAMTAARDTKVAGTILISAANMGSDFGETREQALAGMADSMESLTGTSPTMMVDELERGRAEFDWSGRATGLAGRPLLILSSDDGLAPATEALAATVSGAKRHHVTKVHVVTDHGWSDRRIRLQSEVIRWLGSMAK